MDELTLDEGLVDGRRSRPVSPSDPDELGPLPPVVHLCPPIGWMNDPNGLIQADGVYHAFYQHHPDADVWGPMHWRHASSTDLLTWVDHGVALAPDALGAIFSGSAVIDHDNTSGLGLDDVAPVVAVFTHDSEAGQRQSLAFSLDSAMTWEAFDGNPVLESDERDFRDPKVFRHGPTGRWVMSLGVGHRIEFYVSDDLRAWRKSGEFTAPVPGSSGVWECPDLLEMDTDDGSTWVLLLSAHDAGPRSHSGVVAFVGDFDGECFTSTSPPRPVDFGPDFYAAQSFSNVDGSPLALGWMNSWEYSNDHPSRGRRGVLSLPRRFWLDESNRLVQSLTFEHVAGVTPTSTIRSGADTAFDVLVDGVGTIAVDGEAGRAVMVEVGADRVRLDRHVVDHPMLESSFEMLRSSPEPVRIVLDHGTIEIFADGGVAVMSALFFAGIDWSVTTSGDCDLSSIRP